MTKEELRAHAKDFGLKVKEGFMDDWIENCIVLAIGAILGVAFYKMFW